MIAGSHWAPRTDTTCCTTPLCKRRVYRAGRCKACDVKACFDSPAPEPTVVALIAAPDDTQWHLDLRDKAGHVLAEAALHEAGWVVNRRGWPAPISVADGAGIVTLLCLLAKPEPVVLTPGHVLAPDGDARLLARAAHPARGGSWGS